METAVGERPHATRLRAYFCSAIFFIGFIYLIADLVDAWRTQPISEAFAALRASPWGLTALVDYIIGAVFAILFIWLRETPSLLFINYKVIAVIFPFLGNFVLFLYMSYVIFVQKNLTYTFVPKSLRGSSQDVFYLPANRKQTGIIVFLFSVLLLGFVSVCAWAFSVQSLADGIKDFDNKWIGLTFKDNLGGIVFTFTYVLVREGGTLSSVVPWFLAFAFLGNAATCAYVLSIAYDSWRKDAHFAFLLLSKRKFL